MAKSQRLHTLKFRRSELGRVFPIRLWRCRGNPSPTHAYDHWAVRLRQLNRHAPPRSCRQEKRNAGGQSGFHSTNHRVESGYEAAVTRDYFAPFEEILTFLIAHPFERPSRVLSSYASPPDPLKPTCFRPFAGRDSLTFAGTLPSARPELP